VKSKFPMIAALGVLTLTLAAGIAYAQGPGGPMHRGMHRGFMGGQDFPFLRQLNLTSDQHAQIKQIYQAEKATFHPLMQQEFQAHQQMMQLITSGNFDQGKAATIANQEAQTHMQLEVEHAKMGAQIYNLLDSTQKAKAADLVAQHQQRMQQHMQKMQNQQAPAPPDQQ
jgi:protein CpxP